MKLTRISDVPEIVMLTLKREAVTTSRILAKHFEKRHDHVLRKIDELKKRSPDVFTELKIGVSHYKDASGKRNKEYVLNRDAYAWFAMSFTGEKADIFRLRFIQAFNAMEEWIRTRIDAAREYELMCGVLKEIREQDGKNTKSFHYANEAKLVNWALTGEYKPVEREKLSEGELAILRELEKLNAILLGARQDRDSRKDALKSALARILIH